MSSPYELYRLFQHYPSCSIVQTFSYEERCAYVRATPECQERKFYINYIQLLYCCFQPGNESEQVLAVITLLSICFIMFIILGTTADKFFCPALKMISNNMGLSEHLAGVTVLAFGNGSPDLFTSLASVGDQSRVLFSDVFGTALYVSIFISGIVCITSPFRMQTNNVLRDICFLIFGSLYIEYAVVTENSVTVAESVCILCIYVAYLVIIILDQYLLMRCLQKMKTRINSRRFRTDENLKKLEQLEAEASMDVVSRTSGVSINIDLTRNMNNQHNEGANDNLFKQFKHSLNPIDPVQWKKSGFFVRILLLLKSPINLMLQCIIPLVDYELDRHGWSKLWNTLQIVTTPLIILGSLPFGRTSILGTPLFCYTLMLTVPLAVAIFMTSRTDVPPPYHILIGVYSTIGSVFIIYSCASETVEILYVLGIVTYCSNSFLGCTLLAWGNSLGDLISNVAMARQGYQRMSFAACIGGPLFNSLLGMGGTFLYSTLQNAEGIAVIDQGGMGENCLIFLVIGLSAVLIWVVTTQFDARRSFGILCVLFYGLFTLYAILGEVEVIQTYAID